MNGNFLKKFEIGLVMNCISSFFYSCLRRLLFCRTSGLAIGMLLLTTLVRADYLQVLPSGRNQDNMSNSTTQYYSLFVRYTGWGGSDIERFSIAALDGVVSDICFYLSGTPGVGRSYTFNIMQNLADASGMSVTIADTNTSGCISEALSVSAGDRLVIKKVPAGTPTARAMMLTSFFKPADPLKFIFSFYHASLGTANGTQFIPTHGQELDHEGLVIPKSATMDRLFVHLQTAPGVGKSRIFTLLKNGSASALTCTISGVATTCSDTDNTVSLDAGDIIRTEVVSAGSPTGSRVYGGYTVSTGVEGEFFLPIGFYDLSATETRYGSVAGGAHSQDGTESNRWQRAYQMTVTGMYVSLPVAPGSGKSYTFTFRNNGADGNNTCTVADTDTTCSVSAEDFVLNESTVSIKIVPSGTPEVTSARVSLIAYRTPRRRW